MTWSKKIAERLEARRSAFIDEARNLLKNDASSEEFLDLIGRACCELTAFPPTWFGLDPGLTYYDPLEDIWVGRFWLQLFDPSGVYDGFFVDPMKYIYDRQINKITVISKVEAKDYREAEEFFCDRMNEFFDSFDEAEVEIFKYNAKVESLFRALQLAISRHLNGGDLEDTVTPLD